MAQKQIFLSHRSSQKAWLKRHLVPQLERFGLNVWLDEREIKPLEPITREVSQAIAASHLFLAWWFDGYEESHHCHFEMITALAHCRVEGEHSYWQRVCFAGPDATRLFREAGIFRGLLAPQLSIAPGQGEIMRLVGRLKDRAMQIDVERPFGASKLQDPIRRAILPNPSFVGRSRELLQLLGHLAPADLQEQTAQIVGFAGEGKTELAEEFARRFKFLYPGGIFRINLPGDSGNLSQNELALDSALREFADNLGVMDEPGASRGRLRHLLSEKLRKPYIWLVNDLPTGIGVNTIKDCLAPNDFGGCLITSRTEINGFPIVKIEALPEREGTLLLERLAANRLTPQQREDLHRLVHGHALALSLIGHGVQLGLNVEEFLNPSNPIIKALDELAYAMDADRRGLRSVLATLLTSLSWIPVDSSARRILEVMAHLAPAPVPRELVQLVFDGRLSKADSIRGITDLLGRGIISQQDVGSMTGLQLHPFMAETVRVTMDTRTSGEDFFSCNAILKSDLENICNDIAYYRRNPLSALLLPHSRHRAAKELALQEPETDFAALLARALHGLGDFSGARALEEQILEVRRRILGLDHSNTLISMIRLADNLRALGDRVSSRTLQEQVVDIRRRTLGPEHPDTLAGMADLANTLQIDSDVSGALALQKQVFEVRHRVLGSDNPLTLTSKSNLASIYRSRLNFKTAKTLDTEVMRKRRNILGHEHPDTLISMINLASDVSALGDLAYAQQLQEQVLDIRRRVQGPEHHDTLNAVVSLAGTLISRKENVGASKLIQSILHLLPTITHADLRTALTVIARHLKLLPPEAP